MTRTMAVIVVAVAALFAGQQAFAAPTADELLKMMSDKSVKVKTMEADTTMTMNMGPMGPGSPMKSTGKIYNSNNEVDGKVVRKSQMTMKMTMEAEGMSMTMESKMVNDGTFVWHESKSSMMPIVRVVKLRVGQSMGKEGQGAPPAEGIEEMKKQFDFTKVGEDTIDGRNMWVLEGKIKAEAAKGSPMTGARYYIDQDTLVARRTVMLDKAGTELGRFDLTNIKLNEALDPKLFEYTPPAGAQVQDMTGK